MGPAPIRFLAFDAGTLSWEKPESLSPIAKYKVYKSAHRIGDSGKSGSFLAETTGLSYQDANATSSARTFYAVTAVDGAGNEGKIIINVTGEGQVVYFDQPIPPAPFPPYYPPIRPPVMPPIEPIRYSPPQLPSTGRIDFVPKGGLIVLERGAASNADFSITNGLPVEATIRIEMNPASVGNGTVFLFPMQNQQLRYGRAQGFGLAPGETTFVSLPVTASERALPGDYALAIDLVARDGEGRVIYATTSGAQVRVFAPAPEMPVPQFAEEPAPVEKPAGRIEARVVEEPRKTIRIAVEETPAPRKKASAAVEKPSALVPVAGSPTGFFNLASTSPLGYLVGVLAVVALLTYALVRVSNDRVGPKKW